MTLFIASGAVKLISRKISAPLKLSCSGIHFTSKLNPNAYKVIMVPKRTKFFFSLKRPSAEKMKALDNVSDQYQLIYRNTMYRYLISAQFITTVSAVLIASFVLLKDDWQKTVKFNWKDEPKRLENEQIIYVTAFILLAVTIQSFVARTPVRIYNLPQKDRYIFVFYRSLPFFKRKVVCHVKDITKCEGGEGGIVPWHDSRYELKNLQTVIMVDNFFRRPADLNIMLGYQKNDYDE